MPTDFNPSARQSLPPPRARPIAQESSRSAGRVCAYSAHGHSAVNWRPQSCLWSFEQAVIVPARPLYLYARRMGPPGFLLHACDTRCLQPHPLPQLLGCTRERYSESSKVLFITIKRMRLSGGQSRTSLAFQTIASAPALRRVLEESAQVLRVQKQRAAALLSKRYVFVSLCFKTIVPRGSQR